MIAMSLVYNMWLLFLIWCYLKLNCVNSQDTNTGNLTFVHVVWRHGDRNPFVVIPTDTSNSETTWPGGLSELTSDGIKEHYELGKFLKQRYKNFLSDLYHPKEIYIKSSGFNRTIMSALANVAGMYPPTGIQVWNENVLWQPIPVHSQPKETDPVLWMNLPCPKATKIFNEVVLQSSAAQRVTRENEAFFEFLKNQTGFLSIGINNIFVVADSLICQNVHRRTWPSWVNGSVYEKILNLVNIGTTLWYSTKELQKLRGGLLFYEIASRINQKVSNNTKLLNPKLKYYAYSAHANTIVALAENLGIHNGLFPPYTSALFIELYQKQDQYFVEIYLKNGTETGDIHKLTIPNCNPCAADQFIKLAKLGAPNNWWKECGYNETFSCPSLP